MRKRLLALTFFCLTVAMQTMAQGMKVVEFKLLENDLTANTRGTEKMDQNGERAALIKIQTPERGFTFDGGSLGIVATEEHAGEIWLYVPRRAQKLIVQHPAFGVMRDFYYPIPVSGGRTYEMLIDIGTGRYTNITSQVAGSTIYVDNEPLGVGPIYNKYLNFGKHKIEAKKDRYEGEVEVWVTTEDDTKQNKMVNVEQRDMSDHFGDVTVTVENKADIFFEGKNVGNGIWQTQLREGTYVVETRKADCDPEKTSFTVVAQQQNRVQAAPPTVHTGRLSVYTRPRNAQAILNGQDEIDLTEVQTLPVGTYQISLSRKGYVPKSGLEYTVRHNETTRDTVTMERVKYIKPQTFYFGAGYTIRQLGGVTALAGATYKNFDLQLSYTFGLTKSDPVHWYSTDGNDTYLSSMSYKRSTLAVKAGYQFELTDRLGITPQVGFELERLSGTVDKGTNSYGDGATANCVSIGAKLMFAPIERFYAFINPAYSVAVSKDNNYTKIADNSNISAGGFMMTLGAIFNF